jgi:hypothetical protein
MARRPKADEAMDWVMEWSRMRMINPSRRGSQAHQPHTPPVMARRPLGDKAIREELNAT